MDFTTGGLYASIRRRASIPTTATTGGAAADLLAYVNEELRLGLVAEILKLREGYFKRDLDTAIGSSTSFRMPTRAIGGKLAGVYLLDSAGAVIGDPLPEIQDERQGGYDGDSGLSGYRVKGQSLVLVGGSSTTATSLRQTYYERPNEVVSTGYATVLALTSTVITTSASHGYTTSSVLDFVKANEGFESAAIDKTPTVAAGSSLTFAAGVIPSDLAIGDYVCVAKQSPVPQIPSEFHPILAQRVACAWLEAGGYREQLEAARGKLLAMEEAIGVLSSPRVDTGAKKLIARHSVLGSLPGRSRWGVS
jgi:hypothetical protein